MYPSLVGEVGDFFVSENLQVRGSSKLNLRGGGGGGKYLNVVLLKETFIMQFAYSNYPQYY